MMFLRTRTNGEGCEDRQHGRPSARWLARVDELLLSDAETQQTAPPADLKVRIIDSVRDVQRSNGGSMPAGTMVWRPLLGLAAAACFVGLLTIAASVLVPDEAPPAAPIAAIEPVEAQPARFSLDAAPVIIPAGRMVVARAESPLRAEVEHLRRDTQRATEIVLSSLPFGGGVR